MSYYYDDYISQNILKVENEIFNIPYNLEIYKDKNKKKIFSKVKINTLKSIVQNEYDYSKNRKVGFVNITNNKDKSKINFNIDNGKLTFQLFDEMRESNFNYDGEIYFKPFFMNLNGNLKKLNIDYLNDINSLLIQLLKSEVFNNQNLNFSSNINAEKILSNHKFKDLLINFKIKEGLIDVDNSNFNWSDFANFKITNSLIFIEENTLVLDGTMSIEIKNYNEIYKFFQTPRNYRKEINKLNFNFNYNFDQETLNISDIKIDNQENYKVGNIINKLVSQENMLQNRIYLKNLINRAIKAYSG